MDFQTGHGPAALPRERKRQCLGEVCGALGGFRAPTSGGKGTIRERKTVKFIGHSSDFFLFCHT